MRDALIYIRVYIYVYISTLASHGRDITPPALVSLFYWQTFSEKLWRNMKWGNRTKLENEKLRKLIVFKSFSRVLGRA